MNRILQVENFQNVACVCANWQEFQEELDSLAECDDPDGEQEICNAYLKRFANICVSQNDIVTKQEHERKDELQMQGYVFGTANGDGNCLISSLLQGLGRIEVLPESLPENSLSFQGAVKDCRRALAALPGDSPRRPMQRDLRTNRIFRIVGHTLKYVIFL